MTSKQLGFTCLGLFWLIPNVSFAGFFPMYERWDQPNGPGSQITLTYSFSNLLDGSIINSVTNQSMNVSLIRDIFELSLQDYANVLPINFVELSDNAGPSPETGEYNPDGLADIRVGQVDYIEGANAYAYFPIDSASGLAGDIVFNAQRFGADWTETWFYAVSQHELGHSLGMGHYVNDDNQPMQPLSSESEYNGAFLPLGNEMIVSLQSFYGVGTGTVTPVPLPAAFWFMLSSLATLYFTNKKAV